jgi:hypothetical protein
VLRPDKLRNTYMTGELHIEELRLWEVSEVAVRDEMSKF